MSNNLSIRAYTPAICSHEHNFHQIVFPLHGGMEISHGFKAKEQSRFLVADIDELPDHAKSLNWPFAAISESMGSYCNFVEVQLQHQINKDLEGSMFALFRCLFARSAGLRAADK